MTEKPVRILVVEDNPEDFLILQVLFGKSGDRRYVLENAPDLPTGLERMKKREHDVYLVDYKLGPDSGIEFLKEARLAQCPAPIILLTGHADHELDLKALDLGASDYLDKNKVEPALLDRTVRYSLEQKRSEEALRREEEFYRALIENAQDGIGIVLPDGRIEYLSSAVERILGYSPAEMKPGTLFDLIHPEDAPQVRRMLSYLFGSMGRVQALEVRARHKDGSWRTLEATAKSYFLPQLSKEGVVFNYRDATERKKTERVTSRLATIVESSEDAIFSMTLDGVILSWNPSAQRIYGYSAEEAGGRDISLVVPVSQKPEFGRFLETVRDGMAVTGVVAHQRTKKGMDILLSMTLSPIKNQLGQVVGVSIVARDITESEKAKAVKDMLQAERDQLLERLQLQMERMPVACLLADQNFNFTYWNPAAERMFGYSFREVEGRHPNGIIIPPQSWPYVESIFQRIAQGDMTAQGVYSDNIRKDGTIITCEWYNTPLNDPEGHFLGIMSMALDVTERRKAQEVQAQLGAILQQTTDAVIGSDLEGNIFSWNRGAEAMFGYGLDEIVGKSMTLLAPPELKEETLQMHQLARREEPVAGYETVRMKKDGEPVDVSVALSSIKDSAGKTIGVSAILRDITERKKAEESLRRHEEQLRLVEKMNAIGRLAGGVAHDFNNLLSVIGGNADFMLSMLPEGDSHREEAEEIQKAVRRGAELTKQLLVFGQKQVSQPQPVNLNEMTSEMSKMFKRLIDASVDLSIIQDKGLKPVLSDPGQMQQVLLNLVLNSRDAMPRGGHLIIETKKIEAGDLGSEQRPTLPPGAYSRLTVTDTGEGMSPDIQKRIFEPFFTTKAGKGTGLGLATVYGIVNKWSGHIFVHSTPGMGTTFALYFPSLRENTDTAAKPKQAPLPGRGSETILLAEDEDPVRKILVRTLSQQGYKVLDAANGIDAVKKAWAHEGEIHLLLTDTVMPKMNGKELADELRKVRHGIKVVFMSGYPREILSQQGVLDPGITLIQKPFELDELVQLIRRTLDEK